METIKVTKVEKKDDCQLVTYIMPDNKKRRSMDWSWHPFEQGKDYDVTFKEVVKDDGRTYYNFVTILPAEKPSPAIETPPAVAAASNGYYSPEREERIMRGNALNAAAAALGPAIALMWQEAMPTNNELRSQLADMLQDLATRLVPFLRGETATPESPQDAQDGAGGTLRAKLVQQAPVASATTPPATPATTSAVTRHPRTGNPQCPQHPHIAAEATETGPNGEKIWRHRIDRNTWCDWEYRE